MIVTIIMFEEDIATLSFNSFRAFAKKTNFHDVIQCQYTIHVPTSQCIIYPLATRSQCIIFIFICCPELPLSSCHHKQQTFATEKTCLGDQLMNIRCPQGMGMLSSGLRSIYVRATRKNYNRYYLLGKCAHTYPVKNYRCERWRWL